MGYDAEDDNAIWIFATDLNGEYNEADLTENFSQFERVRLAKLGKAKARGFFTPSPQKGLAKGKGKGKIGGKGFASRFRQDPASIFKAPAL